MITRKDVADLRAGDVVRVTNWYGVTIEGPLSSAAGVLWLGNHLCMDGTARGLDGDATLTVISRAKPPLYVNSDKTEPDPGDVVRDADDESSARVYLYTGDGSWGFTRGNRGFTWTGSASRTNLPARLRLLVDGTTGQVVQ